jgi:YggT family protein
MFGDIFRFLLEITFTLFGTALVLRIWIHAVRLHPFNPFCRTIYQFTNWLVLPIRKAIPAGKNIDWATVVAAWLTAMMYMLLIWLVAIGSLIPLSLIPATLGASALLVAKWTVNAIVWMALIQAVLSWVQPLSPLMPLLQTLTAPMLAPIRRILPNKSSIDFSPLVLFIMAQIVLMILSRIMFNLMGI